MLKNFLLDGTTLTLVGTLDVSGASLLSLDSNTILFIPTLLTLEIK